MEDQKVHVLGILILMVLVTESSVIVRRSSPKEDSSGDGELEKDRKLGWSPGKWDPAYFHPDEDFDLGIDPNVSPFDPEDSDGTNELDEAEHYTIPAKFPSDHDELPGHGDREDENDGKDESEGKDVDKATSDGSPGPFDSEEDFDKSLGGEKEPESPDLEDKNLDKPVGGDSGPPVLEEGGESVHDEADESHKDGEGGEPDEGDDDVPEHVPVDEHDEDSGEEGIEPELHVANSFFDSPFFNLEKVRKYFHQLESALEHVFRQTVDEARLLNGTYANTTEEEVEINGKKYIVHKSIIKGADNHSSIYVETLSSEPKEEGALETNSTDKERR